MGEEGAIPGYSQIYEILWLGGGWELLSAVDHELIPLPVHSIETVHASGQLCSGGQSSLPIHLLA